MFTAQCGSKCTADSFRYFNAKASATVAVVMTWASRSTRLFTFRGVLNVLTVSTRGFSLSLSFCQRADRRFRQVFSGNYFFFFYSRRHRLGVRSYLCGTIRCKQLLSLLKLVIAVFQVAVVDAVIFVCQYTKLSNFQTCSIAVVIKSCCRPCLLWA